MMPQDLENQARSMLNKLEPITPELIRKVVRSMVTFCEPPPPDADVFVEQIARSLEEKLDISMSDAMVIQVPFAKWIEGQRPTVDLFYWTRYRTYLLDNGFPKLVVGTVDRDTDRIVGLLENPEKSGEWRRRGLVVGHVQSGKTANYNGVLCKAADYGYKVIILLAGVHNNLRSQTQQRVEEAFIGVDTDKKDRNLPLKDAKTGVGLISDLTRLPFSLTSREFDFKKDSAKATTFSLNAVKEPVIFVIKKQSSVLRNLIDWFKSLNETKGGKIRNTPVLVIDDEADNASINTASGDDDPTTINRRIRELLTLFEKNSYVGYTATPFANIFIDPDSESEMLDDDLFPRDFIVTLDAPENYVSAARLFGWNADLESIISSVSDHGSCFPERHKINHKVGELPASLMESVRRFVLGRAVRILRGRGRDHSSMLVNVSRFNSVQKQVTALLTDYLGELLNSVKLHAALPDESALADPGMNSLRSTWDLIHPAENETWNEVKSVLAEAVGPIVVRTINNKSPDRLDYHKNKTDGLHVVAVGGLSLSRGFTLEGLMVSYFIRNSIMYDTLLQMGRWFGYRDGYIDVCSLYMTSEAIDWYSHISNAIDELRSEFQVMEGLSRTPQQFGLKVRTHPDSLIVTARNKMRTGTKVLHSVSLYKSSIETTAVRSDKNVIENNRALLADLVDDLLRSSSQTIALKSLGFLWKEIQAARVIQFLEKFINHDDVSLLSQTRPVVSFIESDTERLGLWDICLYSLKTGESSEIRSLDDVVCQQRSAISSAGVYKISGNSSRIASRGAERAGLTDDQIAKVRGASEKSNIPDSVYRAERVRPLLMLHLLDLKDDRGPLANKVCAWGISFPNASAATAGKTVEYLVNTVWWRETYGEDVEEQEESAENVS